MEGFDPKVLKKLADACRKAGIQTFKGFGVEFTLSDYVAPPKSDKKVPQASQYSPDMTFETDGPSDQDLLLWSAGALTSEEPSSEGGQS